MINILYNDLITLISSSSLVPEEQYRITDYATTVSKANYTSAGYKFDIVVTALTTNTLYEYATLMANSTETYFDANALLLYNIKYNVNNIIPGYYNDWVDTNGKGCIYYMSDNLGNEAPFDFKNIKYYGNFKFHSSIDGSDTSQTISTYNSIKEVIDDDTFNIPQVSFIDECHNVSIDINAEQVSISECSNLQIGKSCQDCEFSEVSNVVVGNDFIHSELTFINGGEIGNNNNIIIATNQSNLIIKDNNTSVTLGSGSNGVIIDSNNTVITIGRNAKGVYINASKTINLGKNIEQFNISSSYDVVVADDCKLFTLNQTNHLTSEISCNSITCNSNNYVTIKNGIENVYITEGVDNIILDGMYISSDLYKIIKYDQYLNLIILYPNGESSILEPDGTVSVNPNSFITDAPSDEFIYGRRNAEWKKLDISLYEKYQTITTTNTIQLNPEIRLYYLDNTSGGNIIVNLDSSYITQLSGHDNFYSFELMIDEPNTTHTITFGTGIEILNADTIVLTKNKRNLLVFRTFNGTNYIVNYQGYVNKTTL